MKLKGKVAIVTGASSGMGRDIARLYAAEGASVLVAARREERLKSLVEEVESAGGVMKACSCDLADPEEAEHLVDKAIKAFGHLDILVNNAGIMDNMSGVGDATNALYQKVFDINVRAPFITMRNAIKHFEERGGGVIINIASVGGLYGHVAGAVYTASKHALIGLTKNTGYTYATKNIRCNAICPGAVATEIGQTETMQDLNPEGAARYGLGFAMNPRTGKGSEIATAALFLASDDSSFVNGEALVVDGGWTA